jgi:predicted NUDIX family NTP pyrophosphohydrolase
MTIARSAGVLLYRERGGLEVLLVHPGGPFWRNKDAGAWQIPKGGIEVDEDAETAARREVAEELGVILAGPLRPLGTLRQSGGKLVEAFACRQDVDADAIVSTTFEIVWPPRSGRLRSFPEVDRARWFTLAEAAPAMLASQRPLLDRLAALLAEERAV